MPEPIRRPARETEHAGRPGRHGGSVVQAVSEGIDRRLAFVSTSDSVKS